MAAATIQTVDADGLKLAYRELGSGPPVLLLHGWPTSSFLWRDVMPPIAERNRVIALDLPGFGASDKPSDVRYGFEFFGKALDGFLTALDLDRIAIGVHDVGGPVGMHWAVHRPERVAKVALLNTLIYPEFSPAVMQFIEMCTKPELREQLTSPQGLEAAMRIGVADQDKVTAEMLAAVQEPFQSEESRLTLARAGIELEVEGFAEIARRLPELRDVPLRVIYGERDNILPDIAQTVERVQHDLPQAVVTALPDAGHFLQEDAGPQIGLLLAEFFAD